MFDIYLPFNDDENIELCQKLEVQDMITKSLGDLAMNFSKDPMRKVDYDYKLLVKVMSDDFCTPVSVRVDIQSELMAGEMFDNFYSHIDADKGERIFDLLASFPENSRIREQILRFPTDLGLEDFKQAISEESPLKARFLLLTMRRMIDQSFDERFWKSMDRNCISTLLNSFYRINFDSKRLLEQLPILLVLIYNMFPLIDRLADKHCLDSLTSEERIKEYIGKMLQLLIFLFSKSANFWPSAEVREHVKISLDHFGQVVLKKTVPLKKIIEISTLNDLYNMVFISPIDVSLNKTFSEKILILISFPEVKSSLLFLIKPLLKIMMNVAKVRESLPSYLLLATKAIELIRESIDQPSYEHLIQNIDPVCLWNEVCEQLCDPGADESSSEQIYNFLNLCLSNKCHLGDWHKTNPGLIIKCIQVGIFGGEGQLQSDPVCSGSSSRASLLSFVSRLGLKVPPIGKEVHQFFYKAVVNNSLRSFKQESWTVEPERTSETVLDYVGITNLGSTCYMNSVFQMLFSVEDWREHVLAIDTEGSDKHVLVQVLDGYRGPKADAAPKK